MNFFSRKKTFLAVIVIILLSSAGTYYWFLNSAFLDIPLDTSPEAVKTKCLEDMKEMSEESLMNQIKNIKNAEAIDPITGEKIATLAQKGIIDYLTCKVGFEKNEEYYNKVKKFIEDLGIQENNKQASLSRLEEIFLEPRDFLIELALGDMEEICPDELPRLCIINNSSGVNFGVNEWCKNICNVVKDHLTHSESFINRIINDPNWEKEAKKLIGQYKWRTSLGYRIGKAPFSNKICESIPDNSEKNNCIEFVKQLEKADTSPFCNDLRNDIERMLCRG